MKNISIVTILAATVALSTACQKNIIETRTVNDTLVVHTVDTLVVNSRDTTIPMDVNSWDCYSHDTRTLVAPGSTTYYNTPEGIKFIGQGVRKGTRLQTKKELGFKDKTLYFKWKANGSGQFAGIVVQAKYDPLTYDNTPPIQGVDFANYSVGNSINYALLVQDDVWYYTRAKAIAGSDNYEVTTATGNYGNAGGNIIQTVQTPVFTKSGYLAIRIGDNYAGGNSYVILGECKIASN